MIQRFFLGPAVFFAAFFADVFFGGRAVFAGVLDFLDVVFFAEPLDAADLGADFFGAGAVVGSIF